MLNLYYQSEPDGGVQIPNCTPHFLRNKSSVYAAKNVYVRSIIEGLLDQPVNKFYKSTYNGSLAYFPIEVGQLDPAFFYENVFGLIDSKPLSLIRNPKSQLRLLFWFPTDIFSDFYMEVLNHCIEGMRIPREKVFAVFGNLNVKWNLAHTCFVPDNVMGLDIFERKSYLDLSNVTRQGYPPLTKDEFLENFSRDRGRLFLYKNGNCLRPHRQFFASKLQQLGLISKSYFSWLNRYGNPNIQYHEMEKLTSDVDSIIATFNRHFFNKSYVLDYDKIDEDLNERKLQNSLFLNTYFSFVTETEFERNPDVLFVTEKTYQPMQNFHPFVIAGSSGTLRYLQEKGYATFPELFDETYDDAYSPEKRAEKVINSLVNFKIDRFYSNEIKDKIIHNNELYHERKGQSQIEEFYQWLT